MTKVGFVRLPAIGTRVAALEPRNLGEAISSRKKAPDSAQANPGLLYRY